MNVFHSFDIFKKETLSILKNRIFNLVFIDMPDNKKSAIYTSEKDNKETQINIVNNEQVYNLFTSVLVKRKALKENENKNSRIRN